MNQSDIIAPILSYDDINKRAEDFLREHKRNEILPVNIESIAEFDLGLNIFPFPNLQETFDVEGFISGDLNVIYVDEFIYYQRPARYRFTLNRLRSCLNSGSCLILTSKMRSKRSSMMYSTRWTGVPAGRSLLWSFFRMLFVSLSA